MPNDDLDKNIKQILRGARAMARAREQVELPSVLNKHASRNHMRQGIAPLGLGTGQAEFKARRSAGKAKKAVKGKRKSSKQRLKKGLKKLRNKNLNEARNLGSKNFTSRNRFRSEDNKKVSKPEF